MVELVLTDERRRVLTALLNDDERLRAEYPMVDDYLDVALRLPGTGDARIDAAFDLRFVNYVTGGNAESPNPYWDIVAPFVGEHEGRRVVNGGMPDGSARMAYGQTILQAIYAYAIPSPETMEWVSEFCAGRTVVELGAGRGYWAAQLARAGLKVEAYDSMPPDRAENVSFPCTTGQIDVWHHVGDLGEFEASASDLSDNVLMLCWPPGWGTPMASEALAAFEKSGGQRMVFVGQRQGGMTGDDAFFEALSAGWKRESEDAQHVSWWNLADVVEGWVRR
ncbi:hypothetical protein [Actinokineospora sp. HUAS TT18]|uniref:hypothetical protein n=1 Tax=Actinokineospora sp. HUAS TT18 TaxID=3447451 RepID=UPI003F51C599